VNERGPIQLSPPGLLNLLQLKADGRSVVNLSDTCLPSLEMSDWWLRAAARDWDQTTTDAEGASVPQGFLAYTSNPVTVPNGQWWFVHDYTVKFSFTAGQVGTNIRLAWSNIGSGASARYRVLPDGLESRGTLTGAINVAATAEKFWVPPGARIGFYCDSITGGLAASLIGLRYTPCGS